jgi:cytochrome c oxidase subunit 3
LWTTILLGATFLAGQVYAWLLLEKYNHSFATNTSSSFFFILTGVHAVHLLGGLIALLWAGVANLFRKPPETRRIILDVTAWYWHFMGLLWVYIFGLLYFAR